MNFIDIIIILIIAGYALLGFFKGFIIQLFQAAGIFCAFYFNSRVSEFFSGMISEKPEGAVLMLTGIATFFLIFAVFFISGLFLSKSLDLVITSIPNRIAGIIFGAVNGFFIVTVMFVIVRSFGDGDEYLKKYVIPENDKNTKAYSRLGFSAYKISEMMDPFVINMKIVLKKKLDDIIEEKIDDRIEKIKDKIQE